MKTQRLKTVLKMTQFITVKIKCRGKMQLEAVEEQLRLRHAAGVLEIFFEKQLPTSASKPYIHC